MHRPQHHLVRELLVTTVLVLCFAILSCCGGTQPTVAPIKRMPPGVVPILVFPKEPVTGLALVSQMEPLQVEIRDKNSGQIVLQDDIEVSLRMTGSVTGSPIADGLQGKTTVATVAGVATFDNLRVVRGGRGLQMEARASGIESATSKAFATRPKDGPRFVFLLIADGWGYKQIEAVTVYTGKKPIYTGWSTTAMSTYDVTTKALNGGSGYDSVKAWSSHAYLTSAVTDSASSATAMFGGKKTDTGRISVGAQRERILSLGQIAKANGLATGAVTSVPVSHATPGAWYAHNRARGNTYAIFEEGVFGNPETTASSKIHPSFAGGVGLTPEHLLPDLIIGGGHPTWGQAVYVSPTTLMRMRRDGPALGWALVERKAKKTDAAARLLAAAKDPKTQRLFGLFGGSAGNIEFRGPTGVGHDAENPTLAEMTEAAIAFLGRNQDGFALMVEGGAVDWAGHANDLAASVGEMIGFEQAVKKVVDWIDDTSNASNWRNSLVIITGDHECGLLTAGPTALGNAPLTRVDNTTLAMEKLDLSSGHRASWQDIDKDDTISEGETVYWYWHSGGHSNSLIPLFVKGRGAARLLGTSVGVDPVRGKYIDNTAVFEAALDALR